MGEKRTGEGGGDSCWRQKEVLICATSSRLAQIRRGGRESRQRMGERVAEGGLAVWPEYRQIFFFLSLLLFLPEECYHALKYQGCMY